MVIYVLTKSIQFKLTIKNGVALLNLVRASIMLGIPD